MVRNENTVSLSLRSFGLGVKFFISYFACGYPLNDDDDDDDCG